MNDQIVSNRYVSKNVAAPTEHSPNAERRHRFDCALSDFLSAWNQHEDLRNAAPSISELWTSRLRLDSLRSQQRQLRCSC